MNRSWWERRNDLETGADRMMTKDEWREFADLATAYNRVFPWDEYDFPLPHKVPPMHELSLLDTYMDLVERRDICKKAGIILEYDFVI